MQYLVSHFFRVSTAYLDTALRGPGRTGNDANGSYDVRNRAAR